MRKKLTTWALVLAVALCGVVGALTWGASANADDAVSHPVITRVANENRALTDEEWATVQSYTFTGAAAATGTVKIALAGTGLYFRMEIVDTTKFSGKDRCAYSIALNGKTQAGQGHYKAVDGKQAWINEDSSGFGSYSQVAQTYDTQKSAYIMKIGFDLGSDCTPGATITASFTHNDATKESDNWGSGAAITFTDTFYLVSEPAPVVTATFANATSGSDYVTLPEDSDEHHTIVMGGTDSNTTGNMPEATLNLEDEIVSAKNVRVTTHVKLETDENDANSWRAIGIGIAEDHCFTVKLDDGTNSYLASTNLSGTVDKDHAVQSTALPAWLTIDAMKSGIDFKAERIGHDVALYASHDSEWVLLAESSCHATADTVVVLRGAYCTWKFTDTTVETFTPGEGTTPPAAEMKIKQLNKPAGMVSESEWATLPKHVINTNNNGYVQFAGVGTTVWVRVIAEDTTYTKNSDAVNVSLAVAEGNASKFTMNMSPWTTDSLYVNIDKADVTYGASYNSSTCTYEAIVGMDIKEAYVNGASVAANVTYRDGSAKHGTGAALDSGTATTFSGTLTLDGAPTQPEPDPVNEDLQIVITDLASQPKESDWAAATAYPLIKVKGGTSGATGTVKVYTAAKNIYFRLEVNDPTTNIECDGVYVYLGVEGNRIETRGKYCVNWLNNQFGDEIRNDFGSPSLFIQTTTATETQSWTEGKYTFDYGFHIPKIYGVGNTIRLHVRHRDSQSAAEQWKDSDYTHTIYFDQVMTFGEPADTTVRPQTATEGYTGTVSDISYNKVNVNWAHYTGAESYYVYLYKVNAAGSTEPYEFVKPEGAFYDDEFAAGSNCKGAIASLSQTTDYAVQIVAMDDNGDAIAYSALISFRTISMQEALNPPTQDPGNTGDTTDPGSSGDNQGDNSGDATDNGNKNDGKKKKCGSDMAAACVPAAILLFLAGGGYPCLR